MTNLACMATPWRSAASPARAATLPDLSLDLRRFARASIASATSPSSAASSATISDESVDSSPGPVTMKNHAGERGGVSVLVHQWPVDFGLRGTHAVEPGKSMTADADELVTRPE